MPEETDSNNHEEQQAEDPGGQREADDTGTPPEEMTEEELRAELERQFRRQKVGDVLMQYMVSLSTLAYAKMGLTEDTEAEKDLDQARLAIDSFKSLLDAVGDRFAEQDTQALAGALASMQMTFAKAAEGNGENASSDKEGEATPGDDGGEGTGGSDPASRLWVPGKE